MREKVTAERLEKFMQAVGRAGKMNCRIYLVGGATAVLLGWRETTIDIDLKLVPEVNEILRALPELKEALQINVELAWPLWSSLWPFDPCDFSKQGRGWDFDRHLMLGV